MRDLHEKNLKNLIDYALWLSNDCGDCETCNRTFDRREHEQLKRDVEALPPEYQERFHLAMDGPN